MEVMAGCRVVTGCGIMAAGGGCMIAGELDELLLYIMCGDRMSARVIDGRGNSGRVRL